MRLAAGLRLEPLGELRAFSPDSLDFWGRDREMKGREGRRGRGRGEGKERGKGGKEEGKGGEGKEREGGETHPSK